MRRPLKKMGWVVATAGAVSLTSLAGERPSPYWPTSSAPASAKTTTVARIPAAAARSAELAVQIAWLSDPLTSMEGLAASVLDGSLQVGGVIPSETTREWILRVAKQNCSLPVVDVLLVRPEIVPATNEPLSQEAAGTLQQSIQTALREMFPTLAPWVSVAALPNGQVILRGTAPSLEEKYFLSRRARQVSGCRCVDNLLTVEPFWEKGQAWVKISADGRFVEWTESINPAVATPGVAKPLADLLPTHAGPVQAAIKSVPTTDAPTIVSESVQRPNGTPSGLTIITTNDQPMAETTAAGSETKRSIAATTNPLILTSSTPPPAGGLVPIVGEDIWKPASERVAPAPMPQLATPAPKPAQSAQPVPKPVQAVAPILKPVQAAVPAPKPIQVAHTPPVVVPPVVQPKHDELPVVKPLQPAQEHDKPVVVVKSVVTKPLTKSPEKPKPVVTKPVPAKEKAVVVKSGAKPFPEPKAKTSPVQLVHATEPVKDAPPPTPVAEHSTEPIQPLPLPQAVDMNTSKPAGHALGVAHPVVGAQEFMAKQSTQPVTTPAPAPLPSLSGVRSHIFAACGDSAKSINVIFGAGSSVWVGLTVKDAATGQQLGGRIMSLPELKPFKVSVEVALEP